MTTYYRTQGYVLKKTDLREADQLFAIYTKDYGKIDVMGRAIRKIKSKLRSGIDLFYSSEVEFIQGKAYKTLTDAVLIDKFKNIRNDLEKTKIACQIVESLDKLIKGQEADDKVFVLLNETFNKLNGFEDMNFQLVYYYFLWNLLSVLGYQIGLHNCIVCEKGLIPLKLYFSSEHGGIMCAQCFDKSNDRVDISSETVKIIRLLLAKDWSILKRLKIDYSHEEELQKISDYYLKSLVS